MSAETLAAVAAIALLAAACQSLTAFGFALVMVPLAALAWDVKSAVVTSTLLSTITLMPLLYEVRGRVRIRWVAPMLLGSLAGIAPGIVILRRIDPGALEVAVALVVIVAALLIYLSPAARIPRPLFPLSFLAGVLSGALRAATSMGGPPAVLYVLTFERQKEAFRATLLALFVPTSMVTVTGLAIAGQINGDILLAVGVSLPAVGAGMMGGNWVRGRVSQTVFQTIVLGLLFVSSGAVLASASGVLA